MQLDDINSEGFQEFCLPEAVLAQLFEFTGSTEGDSGFILTYVGQNGQPAILSKTCSPVVEMGLRKALEQYLSQISLEAPIDLNEEE